MSEIMIHLFEQIPFKEAKQIIKEWVDEINLIENQFFSKLVFEDNRLKADQLMVKIKGLEKGVKGTLLGSEQMSVNRCNHEENSTLAFIHDKQTMLMRVQIFVELFNELDEDAKVIIYGSFFKSHFNVLLAGQLYMSLSKLERDKSATIIHFAEMLEFEQFLHRLND